MVSKNLRSQEFPWEVNVVRKDAPPLVVEPKVLMI